MTTNFHTIVKTARFWGEGVHDEANHLYGERGHPYSYHLAMVASWVRKFSYLLSNMEDRAIAEAAAWTHDSIEDARQTYNDVVKAVGVEVAEITYALTNEKGKTRKERANDKYYMGIRALPLAVYVKLCDRLANTEYSVETNSKMVDVYRRELPEFLTQLGVDEAHKFWPLAQKLQEIMG